MPLAKWSEDLSVGVDVLDDEHRAIVEMLNVLYEALREDRGEEALSAILKKLVAYASQHFEHEERMFAKTGFPDAAAHKREHQRATKKILKIQARYNNGISLELCHEVLGFLTHWLECHIMQWDLKYKPYLNKRSAGQKGNSNDNAPHITTRAGA